MIKQISVFIENKTGSIARVTKAIGNAGVDIRALSIADTSDFGILRLIVDNPDKAVEALRAEEITVSLTDVLAVGIDDTPGSFSNVIQILTDANISVEYMYAFIGREANKAFVIIRIEDIQAAIHTLTQNNIRLLESEELYSI